MPDIGKTSIQLENNNDLKIHQSRTDLESELKRIGVDGHFLDHLTIDQLSDLLYGLNKAANHHPTHHRGNTREKDCNSCARPKMYLSAIDKKILKALVESSGRVSTLQLAKNLDIPLSTVQRRRSRIEEKFLTNSYSLIYEKFSLRHVTFLLRSNGRPVAEIAQELLDLEGLTTVTRMFGDGADLKAESIVKSNEEIAELIQKVKTIKGIIQVSWIESMEVLGRKSVDLSIIDSA